MNIFQVMANNLQRGPITLRFPIRVAPPKELRGLVRLNPAECTGCSTCVYVCTSSAIAVNGDKGAYAWDYDPGRCTFCGRCVDFCPTHALTMESDRPSFYTQPGALRQSYRMTYPLCPICGQPAHPVNEIVLGRAFHEIGDEVRAWSRLCDRCRAEFQAGKVLETLAGER
jgi:ferredoxin